MADAKKAAKGGKATKPAAKDSKKAGSAKK